MPDGILRNKFSEVRVMSAQSEESEVQQHQAEMVDLNKIVARHGEDVWKRFDPTGVYGDATGPRDLQGAYDQVEYQQSLFETLPAHVRKMADNNPVRLLEMLEDPSQTGYLLEAGMPEDSIPEPALTSYRDAEAAAEAAEAQEPAAQPVPPVTPPQPPATADGDTPAS